MPAETPTAVADKPTIDAPAAGDKAPADFMADIVGDLEAMSAGTAPPAEKPKAQKPPAETKPAKPATKPPQDETPKPETETKPAKDETPEAPPKPVKAAELRTAYDTLKKKVKDEYEPELQRLRAQVKESESQRPEESAVLLSKIKTLEDRNKELEGHIEHVEYTKSRHFRETYEEPYAQAWAEAASEFAELTVREKTGEDDVGDPIYKTRPANEKDMVRLGSMSLSDMDAAAQEMFGASAARAINHIQNLRKLYRAKTQAETGAKTKAAEFRAQQEAEGKARTAEVSRMWTDINSSLKEKFPKAYAPEAGDEEDGAAFNRGFALADLMFGREASLTPEQIESLPSSFRETIKAKKPLTDMQRVHLHALARIKMANHDRQIVRLKKAMDRIKELETALSEYEGSGPSTEKAGEGGGPVTKDWEQTVADELKALDK